MEITEKQWEKFKIWQNKANRDEGNRRYRGQSQRDPDSVIGYHTRAVKPTMMHGERHHIVGLARMNPVFQTIKTKEQLELFMTTLRENGVVLGDSWEQMIELPRKLHDSSNPEAIHRVEAELGLDDPLRYVRENATFEDALAAIPLIKKDQQESRRRIQELQFRTHTVDDSIGGTYDGFTEAVLGADAFPDAKAYNAANNKYRKRQLSSGKQRVPLPSHTPPAIQRLQQQVRQVTGFGNRLVNRADAVSTAFELQGSSLDEARQISNNTVKRREKAASIAKGNGGLNGMPDLGISETLAGKSLVQDERQEVLAAKPESQGTDIVNEMLYMKNRLLSGKMPYMPF